MATEAELALKASLIDSLAKKSSSPEIQAAATKAKALLTGYQTAIAAGQTAQASAFATELLDLALAAKELDAANRPTVSKSQEVWPSVGIAALVVVVGAFGWFLYSYGKGVGMEKLGTIEGTRPLLVIGAILSTIAFGGALLVGSLFSSEGTFEDRFRHAREVFLVFSGVFGTVIGFYFGAGDTKGGQLQISGQVVESAMVANATGGVPPYKVTLTYGSKPCTRTEESKDGWARFALDKALDNIQGARLAVADARGTSSTTAPALNKEELSKEGWKLPSDSGCSGSKPSLPEKPASALPVPPAASK